MTLMPPEWKYLRAALPRLVLLYDLAYFYLRCRFACDSLPLRNFRLLQICTNLPLPAKAALLALAAIYALSVVGDYTEPAIRFESGTSKGCAASVRQQSRQRLRNSG